MFKIPDRNKTKLSGVVIDRPKHEPNAIIIKPCSFEDACTSRIIYEHDL